MMPEEYRTDSPEQAEYVDMPQVPAMAKPWVWDTNKLVIAALGVLGLGFGVYFLMSYNGAKKAALAAVEAANAAA